MSKRIGRVFCTMGAFFLIATPAFAGDISVTLTADKTATSLEDIIALEVKVSGSQGGSQPVLTHAEDFDVQFAGTSSQIQIINGDYSSSKTSRFLLTPKKAGTFTVGPAQVTIGGTTYESQPLTISVERGAAAPHTAPGGRDRSAFLEVEVSNKKPYVGEQVLYTLRFFTLIPAQNVQLKTPEFEGFVKEAMGDSKSYQRVIDGQAWQVSEIQWALSPMSAGAITIPSPRVTAEFLEPSRPSSSLFDDPFFNMGRMFRETRQRSLVSEPATMDVRPLPETGRPANFSGLVGSFQIALQTGGHEVEAGQSTTFTVTVKGDGDLRSLADLKWPIPPDVKVYDDQPTLTTVPSRNGLVETKTFRKAVVPLKPGDLTLPPVALNFFDPKLGEYKTLDTGPIPLKVIASSRPEVLVASRDTALADARPAPSTLDGRDSPSPSSSKGEGRNGSQPSTGASAPMGLPSLQLPKGPLPRWLLNLFLIVGGIAVIGLVARFLLNRRRKRLAADPHYRRRRKSLKAARRRLKVLSSQSGRSFFEEASFILRDFLGDKFGLDGRALTTMDIPKQFGPLGFSEDDIRDVSQFLNRCEEGIYGGLSLADGDKETISKALRELLGRLSRL